MSRFLRPSLNWLLVFLPVAFALRYVPGWRHETALFFASGLAIVPLAGWMGSATEQLSHRLGQGIGGLLNASFGNAAELIIALMALHAGLIDVVKASITGSIIGNLLLVLGASVFAGGLRHKSQQFNKTAVRASCTALILAASALIIPSVFHHTADRHPGGWTPAAEQNLSLAIACVLLATYVALLIFSLGTHRQLYTGHTGAAPENATADGEAPWTIRRSVIVLIIATSAVAWVSEFLVGAVEAARHSLGVTETFVGIIIVALVGNAAEHSTAVTMALKNKMDLALGIAIGSSLQIALFVAPVLVFCSYFFLHPLNLEFTLPEIAAVVIAAFAATQISGDGESNWLEGVQLLALYAIFGLLFFFLPAAT
ncbi:calcium/proton exchanger [Horticoccus luteus]|uniref:Ca(2+)/H(+) antiporter n=1 Tax=Horticoccus luteus TaxID=2862869 RepID=A0A8F9TV23_9BACT|nr:calcium/proton exchanger [Horticoccus luteus]QYM78650.1 calcium/proton exchanger [Horticoccus luteus]